MTAAQPSRVLWQHPDPQSTQMWGYKNALEQATGKQFKTYDDLHKFSCSSRSIFWRHLFTYLPLVYTGKVPQSVIDEKARIETIPKWFDGVYLNFAENILYTGDYHGRATTSPGKEDAKIAVTEVREGSFLEPIRHVSWQELRQRVARLSQAMRARGVKKGDRIAIVASTCLDTLVVFLATAALGALFSSSSTDMGVKGILDRLLQIRPKFVFFDDAAIYNGKHVDLRPKMVETVAGMKDVPEFERLVTQCRFPGQPVNVAGLHKCQTWAEFEAAGAGQADLYFERTSFSDPFLIVYSSGTTGTPKCIVHSIGGAVLNGHKEGRLHRAIDHDSTCLQYTTTGWIMYAASVQALLTGARILTYDGSPFLPDLTSFLKLMAHEKITHLGTSPKYLQMLESNKIIPKKVVDLSNLKVVTSTGMVLSSQQFQWFYSSAGFPSSVQLDNISGGTDLIGAFGTGNPIVPIYSIGGCQSLSLGYAVEVYDQTIESESEGQSVLGQRVDNGTPGELVCTKAFPTMPLMFYGTDGAKKYFNSYFARFSYVWTHGDFIMIDPATKAVLFLGRADGVLNPSGVRFGSAEIYGVVDKFFGDKVQDSICVGQRREQDSDERVLLFLLMKPGQSFGPDLVNRIKAKIAAELSKRHVPMFIFETKEIPTTVNLKKVELPIKHIVSGKRVKPSGTLLNPGSLEYYYRFAKDENLVRVEDDKDTEKKIRAKL